MVSEREFSGRKRNFSCAIQRRRELETSHKRIYLDETIFQSWIEAKFDAGYTDGSDAYFPFVNNRWHLKRSLPFLRTVVAI